MIKLINDNNMNYETEEKFDLIYADMIYENENLEWIEKFSKFLKIGGIFVTQTDWHTNYLVRNYFENMSEMTFVNHLVQKNEWGNHPKDRFHQCYDDIIIFAKTNNTKIKWKFHSEKIQVPKVTKEKGLNPSGRETKQATAWIDDICLTTTSLERVKKSDGHLIRWQKPVKLFERIISPFVDEGDTIFDPFMGSGSLGIYCILNNLNYVGIEYDKEVYEIAKQRLKYD